MTKLEFYKNLMTETNNLRYADIGMEYYFNHRSIDWLMANYDKSHNAICSILKKIEKFAPTSTTPTTPKYINDSMLDTYLRDEVGLYNDEIKLVMFAFGIEPADISNDEKSNIGRVLGKVYYYMKADDAIYIGGRGVSIGELGNPFYSCHMYKSFGRFYALPVHLRPLFDKIVIEAKEDASIVMCGLFGGMSRAGIAACYHIPSRSAASIVNKYTKGIDFSVVRPSTRTASVVDKNDFFYMMVNNDVCDHPEDVMMFLFSTHSIDAYANLYEGIDRDKFRYEVIDTLTQMYRLMRNNKKVLVVDKPYANISSYTSINEPFSSPYLHDSAKYGCI